MSYDGYTYAVRDRILCRIYPRNVPRAALPPDVFNWAIREISAYVMSEPPRLAQRLWWCGIGIYESLMVIIPRSLGWFLDISDRLARTRFQDLGWTSFTPSPDETSRIQSIFDPEAFKGRYGKPSWVAFRTLDIAPEAPMPSQEPPDAPMPLRCGEGPVEKPKGKIALVSMKRAKNYKRIKAELKAARLELGHAYATIERQNDEIRRLREALPDAPPAPTDPPPEPWAGPPPIIDTPHTLQQEIIQELLALDTTKPRGRRYSETLILFSFLLHTLSPKAYRCASEVLALPAESTIATRMACRKNDLSGAIRGTGPGLLDLHLNRYRESQCIPPARPISCTLAFDAASVTSTGILTKPGQPGSVFSFLMLPLDHRQPDLLVRSVPHQHGHIDGDIMKVKTDITNGLLRTRFRCHFIATDGDPAMNPFHKKTFERWAQTNGNLEVIFLIVTNGNTQDPEHLPAIDLMHVMKSARARIAAAILAINGFHSHTITGESLTEVLKRKLPVGTEFCAHKPLDLLKDDLAIQAFALTNLLTLWDYGEVVGAYFLLPFVCLSLAVRNPRLSPPTRLSLIQTAFTVFFTMALKYPATGSQAGISDRASAGCPRRTLWTRVMCEKGCNLCVCLYWAVRRFTEWEDLWLAVNRIGSHSCECLFGTTRGTLKGDPRCEQFLDAQVNAALMHDIMRALGIRPFIRRFKEVAGCTLIPGTGDLISVEFGDMLQCVCDTFHQLTQNEDFGTPGFGHPLIAPFFELSQCLNGADAPAPIKMSGPMAGRSIQNRFFVLHPSAYGGPNQQQQLVLNLADE
jgi:hypothetical protein